MKQLLFASTNKDKIREVQAMLSDRKAEYNTPGFSYDTIMKQKYHHELTQSLNLKHLLNIINSNL